MGKPHPPGRRPKKHKAEHDCEELIDPLTRGEPIEDTHHGPVDLEVVSENGRADVDEDNPAADWAPDYDDDDELDHGYAETAEDEPDFDDDADSFPNPDDGPLPRLAAGPGRHPGPPHGGAPRKEPAKKVPGKKIPGKKLPLKRAHGAKKHPGHPRQPHEHHPEPVFGPGAGFGPGFGLGRGHHGRRQGRRGRPGDVRAAILTLLAERPMHGYQMIQQIAERSQDRWRPSPGSVYPTLQLLDDEGLIVGSESAGSKKLFDLTEEGRTAAEAVATPPWQQFGGDPDSGQVDLHTLVNQLFGAVAQVAYAATVEQQQHVATILKTARRQIYTVLADAE